MRHIFHTFGLIFILFLLFSTSAFGVTPGSLQLYATIYSIGIEWDIQDDPNHNASCQVSYRKANTTDWQDGQPLFRIDFNSANTMAGSLFFLEADTEYSIQLELVDPDGGSTEQTVTIQTLPVPSQPEGGRTLYVSPGSGGGTGSSSDPFQGIEAAQQNAQAGDTILLGQGSYPGEILFDTSGEPGKYIRWQAKENEEVTLETLRISADHIWIEGVRVEGHEYGLRTYDEPSDVVITGNSFFGCHYCIYLNHGGNGWYITDNTIVGDVDPASGDFGGEGIELEHTNNHTVAYNTISRVADGISYPNKNCDIFGNDIFDVSDDGIEPDYGFENIRIWQNRISNAYHNGISFQPMSGAPWYLIRNQVAAPIESALKFRTEVGGALLAHNTFIGWEGIQKSGSQALVGLQSNNNLYISMTDFYAWEVSDNEPADYRTNLDYDGFDWGNYIYAFKWGEQYSTLAAFSQAKGLEPHGIRVDKDTCFTSLDIPQPPPSPMPLQFITLRPDCNAVDAGVVLANINQQFRGAAPDLGAYETGAPLPHYGVRNGKSIEPTVPPLPDPGNKKTDGSVVPPFLPLLFTDKQ